MRFSIWNDTKDTKPICSTSQLANTHTHTYIYNNKMIIIGSSFSSKKVSWWIGCHQSPKNRSGMARSGAFSYTEPYECICIEFFCSFFLLLLFINSTEYWISIFSTSVVSCFFIVHNKFGQCIYQCLRFTIFGVAETWRVYTLSPRVNPQHFERAIRQCSRWTNTVFWSPSRHHRHYHHQHRRRRRIFFAATD